MDTLVVALALVAGAALATGISMAGLHLIISFVPSPARPETADASAPATTSSDAPPRH